MANPWLKKNPFMSMWLSGANQVAGKARAQGTAETKRQGQAALTELSTEWLKLWAPALPVAPKRKRSR